MTAETPETTIRPEDVPTELAVMLGEALYDDAHENCGEDGCYGGDRASYIKQARWFLADVLPAHEAMMRAKVHAELFGTPEEIAAREARPRERDDPADVCERLAPGHHEQRIRAKVSKELRQDADAHRRLVARAPSVWDEARLARAVTLDNAAARITRGEHP